ncbi:MAG: hypothetical protein ACTHM1_10160 [Solirubrobacteraceae bacterium]
MARLDDPSELTRKQRREQARDERRATEEAQRTSAESRKRLTQITGALIVIAVIGIIVALVATSGSKKSSASPTANSGSSAEAGILETPAPWPPQYSGLLNRIVGNHFPPQSDTGYHVHAVLRIYVEGKQVEVPAEIGIDQQESYLAPLHTHDSSGIIHMEATEPYPFKLSQFFLVWGVKFNNSQIGSYKAGGGKQLAVYANGSQVANPSTFVMKPHDHIVVDYGNPKTFVKEFQYSFPAGL